MAHIQPNTTLPKPNKIKSYYLQIKKVDTEITFTEIFNTLGTVTKAAGIGDQIGLTTDGLYTANKTIALLSPSGDVGQTFSRTISENLIQITPSAEMTSGNQIEILIQVFN